MTQGPLTPLQISQFLKDGYIKTEGCFDVSEGSHAKRLIDESWIRHDIDPHNPDSWPADKIHMAHAEFTFVEEFSPKAYAIMKQLCGGEERIHPPRFSNGFIANYGWGKDQPWQPPSPQSKGWHVDGSHFRHFLDSPEQALLVVVVYSEIGHKGGGTFVAPDSIKHVSKFLAERPEGIHPDPLRDTRIVDQCEQFLETTASPGDIFFIHPFMLHAPSPNHTNVARLMTNSMVKFKSPMQFNRPDGDYSPVEQAILNALGVESFDFTATGPRESYTTNRHVEWEKMQKLEDQRLQAAREASVAP